MNETRHQDHRSLLFEELQSRKQSRSNFTSNSFARFLGLTPSHFNDLMKKRRGLSQAKAIEVAHKLALPDFEKTFFLASIRAEHARSRQEREAGAQELERIKSQEIKVLKLDLFTIVSQWQHFAILELVRLDDFKMDPKWIADALDIPAPLAESSVHRLVQLGLLRETNDGWQSHTGFLRAGDSGPNLAVKSHHAQALTLARRALYEQTDTKHFRTTMLAIDRDKIELAKKRMREFQIEMSGLLTTSAKARNGLFCFAMQFFAISKNSKDSSN